ncbi:MAG: Lhr family helicase, partial [Gaiellaceae bacterium]
DDAARRFGGASDVLERELVALEADGRVVRGALRPGGAGLERVALYYREDGPAIGAPGALELDETELHGTISAALAGGALFWPDLLESTGLDPSAALPALWDLVWAGRVSNDSWQPLRASRRFDTPQPQRRRRRFARDRATPAAPTHGRWSLAAPLFGGQPDPRALAELLLERQGIVTRDGVRGEGVAGGYASVYNELRALETLGVCRRGYFVEGLGGAQFALSGAVERLRERPDENEPPHASVIAAADPAQPYGAALSWPKSAGGRASRVAGALVVTIDGEGALFVERGGRTLVPLREPDPSWLRPAFEALVSHVREQGASRLAIERFDGKPVIEDGIIELLVEAGFSAGPRRAVLRTRQ